ncbi:MAG: lipopolysaccharide heptosyltransferase II [Gammaproteobacteria bacterium]|nr:lipopolysaccharide heptosyltransferase II [Gammaproteobacteria bacterium]
MNARKILIIGPAWVGDMVMVQSLFMALKHQNPGNVIDVAAPAWSAPVLARMPEVRNIVEVDLSHGELGLLKRRRIGRTLRGRYDQSIVLPRSFKSALIPYFAGIPQRTAYRGEMRYGVVNDMRILDLDVTYKAVERYVNLGADPSRPQQPLEIRFPKLQIDEDKRRKAAARLGVSEVTPSVALMPGAEFGPSKRWPAKYFGKLADRFGQEGFGVYVFGSAKDHDIGQEVVSASNGSARNLCGQTSLEEVVDLLSLASIAITNDSGLMHIASAVGCPVVAIYGSITPEYTPPLSSVARTQYLNLECSPCWQKQCPYGHYNCLRDIAVHRVYESARELLQTETD